jgi:hypothetical protein
VLPPPRGPIREARPFIIGGELAWNGLAGLGVNFSYHPIPYLALDSGLGLALTGLRLGVRARANILTGEWTPTFGAGFTQSSGIEDNVPLVVQGEEVTIKVLGSSYVQLVGGVNYTGREGFVFTGLLGYAFLLEPNTRYIEGAMDRYEEARQLYAGGVVISLAFGYAF